MRENFFAQSMAEQKIESISTTSKSKLNVNIGILGHVDSGKTSLARALSTHFSTASIDKSPQEKERGITIELGFSCFCIANNALPERLKNATDRDLQFTLVDCPGHASLIKTIIGGAQIIDFMLLVIDINKGIQTQTAECLVLGEILTHKSQIIVVLNKMDLFLKQHKAEKVKKKMSAIRKVFKQTKFGKKVHIVQFTANRNGQNAPGQNEEFDANKSEISAKSDGVEALIDRILSVLSLPNRIRESKLPFLGAVDHCFSIKGQGTILTATILKGSLSPNQSIEIPQFKVVKKVKCIQSYSKNVEHAVCGDRISLQIAGFSNKMNRGLICSPNSVPTINRCIARCDSIRFFKEAIKSGSKFHISIGHSTSVAKIECFRVPTLREREVHKSDEENMKKYAKRTSVEEEEQKEKENVVESALDWKEPFDFCADYLHLSAMEEGQTFILLSFCKSVCAASDSLLIGARFDNADSRKEVCRLAFCGKIVAVLNNEEELRKLRVYKAKQREGFVEKFIDSHTAIGTNMFSKATDISIFVGLKVELDTKFHEVGVITASFGDSGNFYVKFDKKVKRKRSATWKPKIYLKSKKYIYQKTKGIVQ